MFLSVCTQDPSILIENSTMVSLSSCPLRDISRDQASPVPQNPHGLTSVVTIGSRAVHVPIKIKVVPIYDVVSWNYFKTVNINVDIM